MAVLRLLAEEGIGADVSTLGELRFAQRAGIAGERIVVHGNNKSDEELAAAAEAGVAYVVLDSVEELERARAVGVERMLVRVTPGIEADTHESIRTGHGGSKFGVAPEEAARARAACRRPARSRRVAAPRRGVGARDDGVAERVPRRDGWAPRVLDLGGGLGVPTLPGETAPSIDGVRRHAARGARRGRAA